MTDADPPTRSFELTEIPNDQPLFTTINDQPVVVVRDDEDNVYAVSGFCTHVQAPMDGAWLDGYQLICPWHGARFDVRTGQVVIGPARRPLVPYQVTRNGSTVTITAPDQTQAPNPLDRYKF